MAGGMTTSEMRESRQDSATMATAVAIAVVRLDAIEVAVEVTTDSMPPMSLVMRDWSSPLRVRVKKATDCRADRIRRLRPGGVQTEYALPGCGCPGRPIREVLCRPVS